MSGKKKVKTLCALVKKGMIKKEPKKYIKLVKKPAYLCQGCGRLAKKEERLCHPTEL